MPYKPLHPCSRCHRALTRERHCSECRGIAERERGSAASRGYGARWRKASAAYLAQHPYCVACRGQGLMVEAAVVDHRIPHRGDLALFWAESNWQSICAPHHNAKSARELNTLGPRTSHAMRAGSG
ncbi:MAG TPA: HNH endonuclease signature motif containing protein [Opitutaceae bacterium]